MSTRGFTLIELVLTIVVVGAAAAGLLTLFINITAHSADPFIQHQAAAIGEAYLEEIVLRPFQDPDGIGGEVNRAVFDDIFDYDGLTGPPADQFGVPLGLGDYTVTVAVIAAPPEGLGGLPGADVARIDVTVSHTSGVSLLMSSYRTNR